MTKPDWAERLQRTFRRKYDEGYSVGWNDGFDLGTKKAVTEAKKVFIKRIEKEIKQVSTMVDVEFLDGLNRAIDLIKKGK